MKKILHVTIMLSTVLFFSCRKQDIKVAPTNPPVTLEQTKEFSSEVAQKWQDMQIRILRLPAGPNPYGMNGNRYFAYISIGLYEAVVPGMPDYQSLGGQLSDLAAIPSIEPNKSYHWSTSANAALAFLNKSFYTLASDANKAAIDSLDNALQTEYKRQTDPETFERSARFGKAVAERIFEWSKKDGSLDTYPAFINSTTIGSWTPTAPNPTAVFAPNWGANRLFVKGSLTETASAPPPPYSTDPNSEYYAMFKEVYDISQSLTEEQKATALYFRDNPGFQAGTHYNCIFTEIMKAENPKLDFYAVAMAKTGIALAEAQIGCWKMKYDLLVDRPIRYIREVMGHSTWSPLLTTPPHPEYPSGHSQTGGAFTAVMNSLLGYNYNFTLHTYDNLGMSPRTYNSFDAMCEDVGMSRVYGGIHLNYSCVEGAQQGRKIAENILNSLQFKKG
jgi:hypothetical protein